MSYKEAVDGICMSKQDEEGKDFSDYTSREHLILIFTSEKLDNSLCYNGEYLSKNIKLQLGKFRHVKLPNTNYIVINPEYTILNDGTSFILKKLKYKKDYSEDDFNAKNWSKEYRGLTHDGKSIVPRELYDKAKVEKYFSEDNLYYLERLWEDEHPELHIFKNRPILDIQDWINFRKNQIHPKIEDKKT